MAITKRKTKKLTEKDRIEIIKKKGKYFNTILKKVKIKKNYKFKEIDKETYLVKELKGNLVKSKRLYDYGKRKNLKDRKTKTNKIYKISVIGKISNKKIKKEFYIIAKNLKHYDIRRKILNDIRPLGIKVKSTKELINFYNVKGKLVKWDLKYKVEYLKFKNKRKKLK